MRKVLADAAPHLEAADAVLVVESDVPWFPGLKHPRPEARIVRAVLGSDAGLIGAAELARAGR